MFQEGALLKECFGIDLVRRLISKNSQLLTTIYLIGLHMSINIREEKLVLDCVICHFNIIVSGLSILGIQWDNVLARILLEFLGVVILGWHKVR